MIPEDTWQSLCSNKVQKRYRLFAMVILQIIIFFLFKLCFLKYSVSCSTSILSVNNLVWGTWEPLELMKIPSTLHGLWVKSLSRDTA